MLTSLLLLVGGLAIIVKGGDLFVAAALRPCGSRDSSGCPAS
jgi:hypothetical protein